MKWNKIKSKISTIPYRLIRNDNPNVRLWQWQYIMTLDNKIGCYFNKLLRITCHENIAISLSLNTNKQANKARWFVCVCVGMRAFWRGEETANQIRKLENGNICVDCLINVTCLCCWKNHLNAAIDDSVMRNDVYIRYYFHN